MQQYQCAWKSLTGSKREHIWKAQATAVIKTQTVYSCCRPHTKYDERLYFYRCLSVNRGMEHPSLWSPVLSRGTPVSSPRSCPGVTPIRGPRSFPGGTPSLSLVLFKSCPRSSWGGMGYPSQVRGAPWAGQG